MATILDVSLLSRFSAIFAFLFVLVFAYGILSFSKFFGGSKALQIFLAFLISVFVLLTPRIGQVFLLTVPWLTFFFIMIAFILLAYKMFGVTDMDFHTLIKNERGLVWTILSIVILLMIWGVVQVYGTPYIPGAGEGGAGAGTDAAAGGFTSTMGAIFFHPKVLGAIFLLLMAVFAIGILAGESAPHAGGGHGGH